MEEDETLWSVLEGWIATTRGIEWDPLWLSVVLFVVVGLKIRTWPKMRAESEMPVRGGSYLGRISPKKVRQIERGLRLRELRKRRKTLQKKHGAYIMSEQEKPDIEAVPPTVARQSVLRR